MSRTKKHPPAPDRFTKRNRTSGHAKTVKVEKAIASDTACYAAIDCGVCGQMRAVSVTAWALRKTEHGMKQVPLGICPECMTELRRSLCG